VGGRVYKTTNRGIEIVKLNIIVILNKAKIMII